MFFARAESPVHDNYPARLSDSCSEFTKPPNLVSMAKKKTQSLAARDAAKLFLSQRRDFLGCRPVGPWTWRSPHARTRCTAGPPTAGVIFFEPSLLAADRCGEHVSICFNGFCVHCHVHAMCMLCACLITNPLRPGCKSCGRH